MKYFTTVLLSVAMAAAVLAAPSRDLIPMEHEQYLDSGRQILLRWTIIESSGDIEMEISANCTGWMGISFAVGTPMVDGMGDIIMGGFDDQTGRGYIEDRVVDLSVPEPINGGVMDQIQDVLLKTAWYQDEWSTIRIARKLNTGDNEDIEITPGRMTVAWTYASSDDTNVPHGSGDTGFALVDFFRQ